MSLTNTGGDQLPIIEIEAQAPGPRCRVGASAPRRSQGLRDYLDSKAAQQQVPDADRLQVTGLGAPQADVEVRGPGPVLAIVVMILVFGLGCGALLLALAVARKWRAVSEIEQLEDEGPIDDAPEPDAARRLAGQHHDATAPDPARPAFGRRSLARARRPARPRVSELPSAP